MVYSRRTPWLPSDRPLKPLIDATVLATAIENTPGFHVEAIERQDDGSFIILVRGNQSMPHVIKTAADWYDLRNGLRTSPVKGPSHERDSDRDSTDPGIP